VDLSDDLVVLMMFADGEWEKQMSAVQYNDEKGSVKQLQLEEKEFREVRQAGITMCHVWLGYAEFARRPR
jgi:hypothetical protein